MVTINILKKYKYHIFISFNVIWIWSLLSPNVYYLDDIYRSAGGYYHWSGDYRPFADYLYYFLGLGYRFSDLSPFPQILSLLFIYTVYLLFVSRFSKEKNNLTYYIIFLPIIFNPFMLSNLYFKFDSLFMMLSILLSVISIYFVEQKFYIKAVVFLYISAGLYQPSLIAYVCASLFYIFRLLESNAVNKSNKEIFKIWLVKSLKYFFILSVAIVFYYSTVIRFSNDVNFYSLGHTKYSILNTESNIISALSEVGVIFESDAGFLFFAIMLVVFIISFFYFFKKMSFYGIFIFLVINLIFLLSLIGINIFLENPKIEYRVMISFGFYVSFLLLSSSMILVANYKYFFYFLSLCILYYFFSIALNVSNAQKIKNSYELPLLHNLSDDLYELGVNDSYSYLSSGSINIASLNQIYYKYPIVKKTVKNDFFYIRKIQNYFPYPLNGLKRFNNLEENNKYFFSIVKNYKKVKDKRMYNIYMSDRVVLVFFKERPDSEP